MRDHFGDPAPHIARLLEHAGDALHLAADREADAAEFRHHRESRLVGHVVADEDRAAALERRVLHQFAHRRALVERGLLHLDDGLAGQDLDRGRGKARADRADLVAHLVAEMRRLPVVHRERIALVLDHDAGLAVGDAGEVGLELRVEKCLGARDRAVAEAQLRAMPGDRRQLERLEEQIEFRERPPADEGERAAGALGQALERHGQVRRHHHFERGRRQIEDRSVDVEQHGARWSVAASMYNSRSRIQLLRW